MNTQFPPDSETNPPVDVETVKPVPSEASLPQVGSRISGGKILATVGLIAVVLLVLLIVLLPHLESARDTASQKLVEANLSLIQTGIESYAVEYGHYPPSLNEVDQALLGDADRSAVTYTALDGSATYTVCMPSRNGSEICKHALARYEPIDSGEIRDFATDPDWEEVRKVYVAESCDVLGDPPHQFGDMSVMSDHVFDGGTELYFIPCQTFPHGFSYLVVLGNEPIPFIDTRSSGGEDAETYQGIEVEFLRADDIYVTRPDPLTAMQYQMLPHEGSSALVLDQVLKTTITEDGIGEWKVVYDMESI